MRSVTLLAAALTLLWYAPKIAATFSLVMRRSASPRPISGLPLVIGDHQLDHRAAEVGKPLGGRERQVEIVLVVDDVLGHFHGGQNVLPRLGDRSGERVDHADADGVRSQRGTGVQPRARERHQAECVWFSCSPSSFFFGDRRAPAARRPHRVTHATRRGENGVTIRQHFPLAPGDSVPERDLDVMGAVRAPVRGVFTDACAPGGDC